MLGLLVLHPVRGIGQSLDAQVAHPTLQAIE